MSAVLPTVSVVIPAYNAVSRYVADAIASVRAQRYPDLQLIVVDDASTDDTVGLLRRYPDIHAVPRSVNGGQAAARNDGARVARGEFLAFLDQDDLWEPDFLQETVPLLQADLQNAVVHTDGYQVSERNDILEYDGAMKDVASITQMLRGRHDVATSGSPMRRTCFEAVGGYDASLRVWEDIDLAIRLYRRFRIVHLPKPLYRHRLYGHNVSRDIPSERALLGRRRFLEKYAPSCAAGSPEGRALQLDWARYYGDEGKHLLRRGDKAAARRAFCRALRYRPADAKMLLRWLRAVL